MRRETRRWFSRRLTSSSTGGTLTQQSGTGRRDTFSTAPGSNLDEMAFSLWSTPFIVGTPGLFPAGDIRSGSTKRVAAAVGEGSAAVRSVHEYLTFERH
jgi:hypothetical protein